MEDLTFNILLVEDDEVDIMNVKRAFKKINVSSTLFLASDGLEALALLRQEQDPSDSFDSSNKISINRLLILLDLNMPKMNGIEFLRELRADEKLKSLPVVVLTTSNQEQDRVEAYQFNVAGYLVKPVVFNNFVETMAAFSQYWKLCKMP
ncbi:MAG: response regulator [Snowella sp.]|nr:response regulator [Snowella sp.]